MWGGVRVLGKLPRADPLTVPYTSFRTWRAKRSYFRILGCVESVILLTSALRPPQQPHSCPPPSTSLPVACVGSQDSEPLPRSRASTGRCGARTTARLSRGSSETYGHARIGGHCVRPTGRTGELAGQERIEHTLRRSLRCRTNDGRQPGAMRCIDAGLSSSGRACGTTVGKMYI